MSQVTVPVPAGYQREIDAQTHALLQQLVSATPAQISTWLTANVTTLAQANNVLQALAVGLRYIYLKQSGS
jgi:hypothetical protein